MRIDSKPGRRSAKAFAAAALLLLVTTTGNASAKTPSRIAAQAVPGVVSITSVLEVSSRFGPQQTVAGGTEFVLDATGRILTNDHVVDGATAIRVSFADGTKAKASLVALDPLLDLAVIKVSVPKATLHPLRLGNADTLRLGDPLTVIGNPFGLDRSVSAGVVSGLNRQITAPNGFALSNTIQTDAAINHGNSGGPLLDENGAVVGVSAQIADSGVNANVGVGFAIALDQPARKVITALAAGRTVKHAWLGVSLDDIDALLATSGHVKSSKGVWGASTRFRSEARVSAVES